MQNLEILAIPVIALMGLAFAYSTILRYSQEPRFTNWAFGLLFGCTTLLAMTFPIRLADGFLFDLRNLLLGLCVVFAGWRAGLIALIIALAYRYYLGGGGMATGVAAMVLSYAIACAWRHYAVPRIKNTAVADLCFGLAISGALAALFLLPKDMALMVLKDLAPLLTLGNIIGAVALGFVLRREVQFFRDSEKLRMHAMRDPLTHLLNRRGTEDALRNITHHKGEGRGILCFDVDNFKRINDTYGHEAGDTVLSTIVSRIERSLRAKVIFSRHGGDEFTLYFANIEERALPPIADRICRAIAEEPVFYAGTRVRATISVGGYWTLRGAQFEDMLRKADEQLLISKDNGRNRFHIATDPVAPSDSAQQPMLAYAR